MDRFFLPYHSPLSLTVVGLLCLVSMALYVWRLRSVAERRDRLRLLGLRLLAVGGIVGAYLQYGLQERQEMRQKGRLAVLFDASASMGDRRSEEERPAAQVRHMMREQRDWWDRLEERWEVRYYRFSRGLEALPGREAEWEPRGGASDLFGALRELSSDPEGFSGVLLLSDGVLTGPSGEVPSQEAWSRRSRESAIAPPVWLQPRVPAREEEGAFLAEVEGLSYLLVRDASPVRIRVAGILPRSPALRLEIREGTEVLASVPVMRNEDSPEAVVETTFLPRKPGLHAFQVRLEGPPEVLSPARSRRWFLSTAVRDSIQVLLLAGEPSWDVRFLRGWLRARNDVDLVSFVTLRSADSLVEDDDETTLVPLPARDLLVRRIENFDLVILQNEELRRPDSLELWRSVEQHVRNGGALWVIGGGAVLGTVFPWPEGPAGLLPIQAPPLGKGALLEGVFPLDRTPAGRTHPASRGLGSLLESAPPMTAVHLVGNPAPDGEVLLRTGRGSSGPEGIPVLVTAPRGKGRVALLATDTLWRWAAHPQGLAAYDRLLRDLVSWLIQEPETGDLQVRFASREVLPGSPMEVEIEASPGVEDLRLTWEVLGEDGLFRPTGPEVPLNLDPERRTRAARVFNQEGVIRTRVRGSQGGQEIEAVALGCLAAGPGEREDVGASRERLAAWVRSSGGLIAPLDDPPDPDRLPFPVERPRWVGVSRVKPLWNHPMLWLALVAILMAEWYLERKMGYT